MVHTALALRPYLADPMVLLVYGLEEISCGAYGKPQQKNNNVGPYHNPSKSMQSVVTNHKPFKKQFPSFFWTLVVF